jgi:putative iron-dependent peroxidase
MQLDPKSAPEPVRALAQPIVAPLSRAAIFLVVTLKTDDDARATLRSFCGDLSGIFRAVEYRNIEAGLSCIMGIGSSAWDRALWAAASGGASSVPRGSCRSATCSRPRRAIFYSTYARSTWIYASNLPRRSWRASGMRLLPVDEVHGFKNFDDRDLVGFVDGTENPRGQEVAEAALVGEEDAAFAGGSYVMVQKYLHDMNGWNALSTEAQEKIIGRKKLSDIELDASAKPTCSHSSLTTIEENGKEMKILRDNMPFGNAAQGEFGTYFIGYCRTPRTLEQMLENMFVGRPPGNYDRLLDFSRAVTGNLFFAPSATFLEALGDD